MELKIKGIIYNLTEHAKYRMERRSISVDDVVEALENIKSKIIQVKNNIEDRFFITGRNRIGVVIGKYNAIITVYNYTKQYYDSKAKNKFNKNRRQVKRRVGNRIRR